MLSIAQSAVFRGQRIKAIYLGEVAIGFSMYGIDSEQNNMWVSRFMIDKNYQNKGCGKKGFALVLKEIEATGKAKEIYLSFEPENKKAQKMYESFGFQDTGKVIDGELVFVLQLKGNK